MPKYQTELFGQVIYAAEISYDGLLSLESDMQAFITGILEKAGGQFLAFESEGDRTFFQCAFTSLDEKKAEELAGLFAARVNAQFECKLMFVDRMLDCHLFYTINKEKSSLQKLKMPESGPIDKALKTQAR